MKNQVSSSLLPLLVLLVVLPLSSTVSGGRKDALVGGWTPIQDPKEPHVTEIGEFAVSEHNKQAKASLVFESVISGETQVVSGINYKLILAARDGAAIMACEAVVWEKPWESLKNLTSFKVVN